MSEQKIIPNVTFMLEYFLPHYKDSKMQDKRQYYSSNKYNDYIKYVSTGIGDLKNIDFVEYANNKTKSSGIFNKDGKMNKQQIADTRKQLRETESIIWSAVISFEENFGLKWCNTFDQAQNILQSELPKFFKKAGLKIDNMEWFAGLHENTDNRHIHLVFFEKKPIRLRNDKRCFSIGKLSGNAIAEFKANIELCATDYKAREILIRKNILKGFEEDLRGISSLQLKHKLLDLANHFPQDGALFYASENMQFLKNKVDNITDYIISKNPNIKEYKNDFDDIVAEKDNLLLSYAKRNSCSHPKESVGEKMLTDLYRRVGNMIIIKAKEIKKEEIERLKFNAKNKIEKRLQKQKLSRMLDECLYLNEKVEYEMIKAFQDYQKKLSEMRIKTLIEQGYINSDELEM